MENTDHTQGAKTILVPVDYSPYSISASRYAANIASKSGNNICFYHAYYSPAFDLIELTGGLNTQQQLREDVSEKLLIEENVNMQVFLDKLHEYPEFKKFPKEKYSTKLTAGIAKEEILSIANEIKPDMVIMGTRAHNKKSTSILGSTTEASIKKLKVPVIAIPEGYKFKGEENIQNIVYLTNYDESDFVSIKKLMQFTSIFNLSIHCLHIGNKTDKWEDLKMEGLKDYFQKVYSKDSVECHIIKKEHDLLHSIDKYVAENNIDLISLTYHQRRLLEKVWKPSLTKEIFYHTEIPLMVFHS